jgi:hypothetical protein
MFSPTTRYGQSVLVVLVCLGAGIIEAGLFAYAVNDNQWNGLYYQANWDLALAVNRAGILTSAISIVAGVVGARQKPTLGISELGAVIGFFGLVVTLFIEAVSHICFVCI